MIPPSPASREPCRKYGDVNVLSMDIGTSKLAQGNCGHSVVGEVEKYDGPAITVAVFAAPNRV